MCPYCLATAALFAGSVATTGGLAALVLKKVATRKITSNISTLSPSKEDHNG
ncbi:MAG: hypothetical protein ABR907_00215 [Terracidiphilus sp.]|jgi:hypothetical protein